MNQGKLDSIQVGRALAALCVVFYHSHLAITNFPQGSTIAIPGLYTYGFWGVQLFFVLSGFIVCFIASRADFNWKSFLIKRFFRIYPLFALFCVGALVLQRMGLFWLGGNDYSWSVFFRSILLFPQEAGPIYAVGWSLEYEIVFYLLAALFLPLGGVRLFALALGILAAAGILWHGWDYRLLKQMPFFLIGVLCYPARGFLPFLKWRAEFWGARLLVRIGDVSFSLYLVHWFVFAVMNRLSNYVPLVDGLTEVWRLASIALSLAVSAVIWRFFERPTLRLGHATARRFEGSGDEGKTLG